MNNRCAIYLKADPLMKKDVETIRRLSKTFQTISILVDRKRNLYPYHLSYIDRVDIIKHDLHEADIYDFEILPVDGALYDNVIEEGIKNIAMELTPYTQLDNLFEREKLTREMIPDANIVIIPNFEDNNVASSEYLYVMLKEDATHKLHTRYISDYAYVKTKLRLMEKIGLTGNRGCGLKIVIDQLKQRDYEVLDLDQHLIEILKDDHELAKAFKVKMLKAGLKPGKAVVLEGKEYHADKDELLKMYLDHDELKEDFGKLLYDALYLRLAKQVLASNKSKIVIASTLLFEFKLDWMFEKMITVYAPNEVQMQRLVKFRNYDRHKIDQIMKLQIPIDEKVRMSDYCIDGSKDEQTTIRSLVGLLNRRLEPGY